MKKFIVLMFCLPTLCFAGAAEKEAASELLNASKFEKVMDNAIETAVKMVKQMDFNAYSYETELRAFYKKHMGAEALREDFIEIYAREFTAQELKEIAAFHRTPTGQKALEKLPILMQEGMNIAQKRITSHADELQEMITNKPK